MVHEIQSCMPYAEYTSHMCQFKCEDFDHCYISVSKLLGSSYSGCHHPQVDKVILFLKTVCIFNLQSEKPQCLLFIWLWDLNSRLK